MSLPDLRALVLITLVVAGCGGGGLEFWLYPTPHLPEGEDAVFSAYESHRVLFIDGEDTATMCFGDRRNVDQGYRRNDILCRIHLAPGTHTLTFQTGLNSRQSATLDFEARPGRVYGLRRANCTAGPTGIQQNCRFEVVEFEEPGEEG